MYISSYPANGSPLAWRPPAVRYLRAPAVFVRGRGLGYTLPTGNQIGAALTAGTTIGAGTAISTGSEVAGGIAAGLLAAAPFAGPAAPFLAAAGALVGPIAQLFKGCGQSCILTTQFANQVQQAADQLNSLYWGSPVRTVSMQQGALAQMNQLWQYLASHCSAVGGQGGAQCIADRQRGGKYDFFSHYVDPIANDSAVVADPSPAADYFPSLSSATVGGLSLSELLLPAALIAAGLAMS